MVFQKWARELAEQIDSAGCPLEVDFVRSATPIIEAALSRRLAGRSYWNDPKKFGRVWSGPFSPNDTMHYGYTDGELLPDGRLCWTVSRTAPPGHQHRRISEAEAIALLIDNRWPNVNEVGLYHEDVTALLAAFLYDQPVKIQCA
jgi:hypothetical protein